MNDGFGEPLPAKKKCTPCECPVWWPADRGCYIAAKMRYADGEGRIPASYPTAADLSPDGRSILKEFQGWYEGHGNVGQKEEK